jgi:hypothetical protein
MSEPAKSVKEIEDVLASIRRLVSDSDTAQPKAAAAPPPAREPVHPHATMQDADTSASKLVLTPEYRVTDPDDPWVTVPVTGQEGVTLDAGVGGADEGPNWDPEDRLLDWGGAEASALQVAAEQPADPKRPLVLETKSDGADLAHLDGLGDAAIADFEPETGDADWPDGSAGSALRELVRARGGTIANPEAPFTDAQMDVAKGDTEDLPRGDAETVPNTGAIPVTEPWQGLQRQDEDELGAAQGQVECSETAEPAGLAVKRQTATDFTPIFSRRPKMHAAIGEEDADGLQSDAVMAEELKAPDAAASVFTFTVPESDDDLLLDEATLRAIIAEVVREELRGATGQHIKRYVRKVVRREIGLVLGTDDLDE